MLSKNRVWLFVFIGILCVIGWNIRKGILEQKKTVVMVGSVAMETFAMGIEERMQELKEKDNIFRKREFEFRKEGVEEKKELKKGKVVAQFIGSSAGVEALLNGKAHIAMVSRYLTEEEKQKGLIENIVAYDSIVVVVNKKNPINSLSKKQLVELFSGRIANWKQLGGVDEPIISIGRELGSGTRDEFEHLLGIKGKAVYANECDNIGIIKEKVSLLLGGIGYISYEVALEQSFWKKSGIKILAVEQTFPTKETIANGTYFLIRPFIFVTKGRIEQQMEEVQEIFDLLSSEQGEIIFERAKVVPATEKFTNERGYTRSDSKSFYQNNGLSDNHNSRLNDLLPYL